MPDEDAIRVVEETIQQLRDQIDAIVVNSKHIFGKGNEFMAFSTLYSVMLERTLILRQALVMMKHTGLDELEQASADTAKVNFDAIKKNWHINL